MPMQCIRDVFPSSAGKAGERFEKLRLGGKASTLNIHIDFKTTNFIHKIDKHEVIRDTLHHSLRTHDVHPRTENACTHE